jgi:hypothetical protein
VAPVRPGERHQQGRLARVQRAVSGAGQRGRRERVRRQAGDRQAGVTGGERDPGADGDHAGPEPVDQRAGQGRGHDRGAGDRADHQAGDAQAEPAAVVQVDDLEGQDGAVAEHVEEDPDLDEPQLP